MTTDPAEIKDNPMPRPDSTGSDRSQSLQESKVPKRSQFQLSLELEPGAKLSFTVETTSSKPAQPAREVTFPEPNPTRVTIKGGTESERVNASYLTPDGLSHPIEISEHPEPIIISPEMPIRVTLSRAQNPEGPVLSDKQVLPKGAPGKMSWAKRLAGRLSAKLPLTLVVGSSIIYLAIHLIGLLNFPIYFFVDEAASTIQAADFVNHNFRDFRGELFPTFFQNGGQFCLSTSVYLQVIPYMIFGKSEWVVRFITVLVSLLGVIWVGLILRDIFKKSYWWSGVMLLGLAPAWFMSSRTGFEYTLMVTLFTGFIYYYLLYRVKNPRYLFTSLVLGALAFYAYTPGQVIMVVMGLLLLISDWRYHWQQRKTSLPGLGLVILLALPLARFIIMHPGDYTGRLLLYGSYLTGDGTFLQKAGDYLSKWLSGLNPLYYFFANDKNLPVYTMKGYGQILWPMLPFTAFGSWLMLKRIRQSEYRLLLLAFLSAPTGAALVAIDSNRTQVILVPAVLLAAIGLDACLDWLKRTRRVSETALAIGLFLVLAGSSGFMLRDALVNGPTWFTDYGLSGMQYGARQVFSAAQAYQKAHPEVQIYISPNWTFQGDVLKRFFLPDNTKIMIGSADGFVETIRPEINQTLFVLTPGDYQKIIDSGEFKPITPELVIPYPDGEPGFYFARLQYRDDIQQIMEAIIEKRRELVFGTINLDGQPVRVGYSKLDIGPIDHAFDGDLDTLIKTSAANPLVIELYFSRPRPLSGLIIKVGSEPVKITAYVHMGENIQPLTFTAEAGQVQDYKEVPLDFGTQVMVQSLRLEVLDVLIPEPANVHVWEVTLR